MQRTYISLCINAHQSHTHCRELGYPWSSIKRRTLSSCLLKRQETKRARVSRQSSNGQEQDMLQSKETGSLILLYAETVHCYTVSAFFDGKVGESKRGSPARIMQEREAGDELDSLKATSTTGLLLLPRLACLSAKSGSPRTTALRSMLMSAAGLHSTASIYSQHSAFDGILVNIRGVMPRANPAAPCRSQMMRAASLMPRAFRIAASSDDPRVCSSVLHTSSGVVTAAATAPAIPPAVTCVHGEYCPSGFNRSLQEVYTRRLNDQRWPQWPVTHLKNS